MWVILPGWPRLHGWYQGITDSVNSAYHNHGDQNPVIPYQGMVYVHRSNAIIAYGKAPVIGELPLLTIQPVQDQLEMPSVDKLSQKLEDEIGKILEAGHLRPGYFNNGQFLYPELSDYFNNPGDTLYTLSIAYPHLSSQLQEQVKIYLQMEFQDYFNPIMYSTIGWAQGASREAMPLPPDVRGS
jgi:hypothetical protein